jgi:hypothetical protein
VPRAAGCIYWRQRWFMWDLRPVVSPCEAGPLRHVAFDGIWLNGSGYTHCGYSRRLILLCLFVCGDGTCGLRFLLHFNNKANNPA